MLPETVLLVILRLTELALEVVKHIPAEQQANFWVRHEERVEFVIGLFKKTNP